MMLMKGVVCLAQKYDNSKNDAEFTITYRSYYPFIFRYCIAKLGGNIEDAEECTQEVFYVLYQKYCSNTVIENPKAFLIRSADYIILRKVSSKHKNAFSLDEIKYDSIISDFSDEKGEIEFNDLVERIKSKLNEPDKTIFTLRYIQEKSVREISEITGISITNITTRISRFRGKVQEEINKWRR